MAVKFTPSEWVIGPETTEHGLHIEHLGSTHWEIVAYVPVDYCYRERAEANARLIAAAPELLEVCTAIKMARDMGFAAADILAPDSEISRALDAAILKATGEA
jgi:hypothetical protein